MTATQIIGALLIALVFAALFAMTVQMLEGFWDALIVWAMSLFMAAVIAVGAFLLVGA